MSTRARDGGRTATSRALGALGVVAALSGVVVGAVAWAGTRSGATPTEVVDRAVAASPPATVAPASPPTTTATTTAPSTTAPLSPLAGLLGERGSAIPAPSPSRPAPVGLAIESIGLLVPVRAVGVDIDLELEVPDESEVGWYRFGAAPGEPGATVLLAAHVSWNGRLGPFAQLGRVEPGERIVVGLADGSTRTYEVVERTMYRKTDLPADRVWTTDGAETLVLITCGGSFNPSIRRYRDNIVVFAVPVA